MAFYEVPRILIELMGESGFCCCDKNTRAWCRGKGSVCIAWCASWVQIPRDPVKSQARLHANSTGGGVEAGSQLSQTHELQGLWKGLSQKSKIKLKSCGEQVRKDTQCLSLASMYACTSMNPCEPIYTHAHTHSQVHMTYMNMHTYPSHINLRAPKSPAPRGWSWGSGFGDHLPFLCSSSPFF